MKEIIEQYGGAILAFVVVIALIGIMAFLLKSENGTVSNAFKSVIDTFFNDAKSEGGIK